MNTNRKTRIKADMILLASVFALTAVGMVMVFNSSAVLAYEHDRSPVYFFVKQAAWALGASDE